MNTNKLRKTVVHYVLGLLAASWNGGIGAVAGIVGIAGANLTGVITDVRMLNGHEMLSAFIGAFILHAIMWLKAHPLPEDLKDSEPPFPPQL
jgi:uncharacterized membrane protein YeaQ/YmgE (transglycosylase-associated protein family)